MLSLPSFLLNKLTTPLKMSQTFDFSLYVHYSENMGDPLLLPFGSTMRYNARGTTHLTLLTLIGHDQEQEGIATRTRLETYGDALCMTSRQVR